MGRNTIAPRGHLGLQFFRIFALVTAFSGAASGSIAQAPDRELTKAEKLIVANAVENGVSDPTSVLFKWHLLTLQKFKIGADQVNYCGLYNAKNRMGGYVGFSPYLAKVTFDSNGVVVKATALLPSDEAMSTFNTNVCKAFGYDLSALSLQPFER